MNYTCIWLPMLWFPEARRSIKEQAMKPHNISHKLTIFPELSTWDALLCTFDIWWFFMDVSFFFVAAFLRHFMKIGYLCILYIIKCVILVSCRLSIQRIKTLYCYYYCYFLSWQWTWLHWQTLGLMQWASYLWAYIPFSVFSRKGSDAKLQTRWLATNSSSTFTAKSK